MHELWLWLHTSDVDNDDNNTRAMSPFACPSGDSENIEKCSVATIKISKLNFTPTEEEEW